MSFSGAALRYIEEAHAVQVLSFRTFGFACALMVIACVRRKTHPLAFFGSLDWIDVKMGALIADCPFHLYLLYSQHHCREYPIHSCGGSLYGGRHWLAVDW